MTAQILPPVSHDHTSLRAWTNFDGPEYPATSTRQNEAPLGFPASIQDTPSWLEGNSISKSQILDLEPADVTEIEQALKQFLELELDGSEVTCENFPLPGLGPRLKDCAVDIHQGSGLSIVRGLTPGKYSAEDNTIIFLALAGYIGGQRGVQSSKGAMLTHVYESESWKVPREKRHGIHTNHSLPFHNDMGCDILALHVRSCAAQGGGTFVASASGIYNTMMQTNPWAVNALAKKNWPVQVSRRGAMQFVHAPLLGFESGKLVVSVDPSRLGPHPAIADGRIPDLQPLQKEALAVLQQTATAQRVQLPTVTGDMVFINNWAVLHARDSYQDDGKSAGRHLVRLWLRNPDLAWKIPESMQVPLKSSFGAAAEKIINRKYPVMPLPEYMEPKFTNGSAAFVMDDDDESDDAEE